MQHNIPASNSELNIAAIKQAASSRPTEQKVLVFPAQAKEIDGKQVHFLFSLFQMDDILTPEHVQQVPFSPAFIAGITDWRGKLLPIISLEGVLGLETEHPANKRVAVIHSPGHAEGHPEIIRGMVQISHAMKMLTLPIECTPSPYTFTGKEDLVYGVYDWPQGYLVVMNMERILNGNILSDNFHVQ